MKIFRFLLLCVCCFLLTGAKSVHVELDRDEARRAFDYLNQIRSAPSEYSRAVGVSLRSVKAQKALVWNDTLARVAEQRALDMAQNNYFSHINRQGEGVNILIHRAGYPLPKELYTPKKQTSFESIAFGYADSHESINELIRDRGVNPPNHRRHLLGMTPFWAECFDAGVGFVRTDNPEKPTYICIIIAKRF